MRFIAVLLGILEACDWLRRCYSCFCTTRHD